MENQTFRKNLGASSLYWFFHIYFSHYITCATANFQKKIYKTLDDWSILFALILAFRGSAKSAIASLAFPISAVVTGKVKFPLMLSDTFRQAKQHIYNLKTELETNKLLIKDWGPFEENEEWTSTNIVLPQYDARIIARSKGQKIRGIRHKQYRPQLAIIDDPENLEGVRIKEQRDKLYRWLIGDVFPALSEGAKIVLIGNLLHSDSLMMKFKRQLEKKERDGILLEIPIINDKGEIAWEGKFPNKEAIERKKREVNDYRAWQREYLLKLVPEEGQEIKDDWIKHYDEIPEEIIGMGTGEDLASSKKETANFTAMVSGKLAMVDGKPKIFVMPNPVNERLSPFETAEKARTVSLALGGGKNATPLWIEDVAYQRMQVEAMERMGLPAEGIKVSSDKRIRLRTVATYVENGQVVFPRTGCEDLIIQLTGFGVEAHDDLCDAFVLMVQGLMNLVANEPKMTII